MTMAHDEQNQFELLGLINANRNSLKRLIHAQFVAVFLLIAAVVCVAHKPPLVIRIDKIGNTDAVKDYHEESANPTEDDVKFFSKRFLDDYIALKSNLVVRQFETSLNMMTTELAKQHLKAMKEQNTVGIVQAAGIRNDLKIGQIHIEPIADEFYVKVDASLETRPLDDLATPPKIKSIVASLVLERVPRTSQQPYALLAKGVQILVDKKAEQAEGNLNEVVDEAALE